MTWLQRAAHVRDGASRLETALLYAEATGSPQPLRLRVAQLPRRAGDRWVGTARDAAAADPERAAVARRAVGRDAPPASGAPLAGLVVDEWTEVIPDRTQLTGVSFHVDQPAARAPQTILLAVAPNEAHVWSLATPRGDRARDARPRPAAPGRRRGARRPDRPPPPGAPAVPRLGHYLPAIYLAAAPAADTVTTDLGRVTAPAPS